jgi:hypothetical protein
MDIDLKRWGSPGLNIPVFGGWTKGKTTKDTEKKQKEKYNFQQYVVMETKRRKDFITKKHLTVSNDADK